MIAPTLDSPRISYPEGGNAACAQVEDSSFWFRHRNRVILDQLERFPPGGTLWDIGGGNGFVSLAMQEAGHDVVLVEPGESGCRSAEARGVREVKCGLWEDHAGESESVPAAGLFDVLEHIQDDAGFLQTLAEAMPDGGRLFLTVPAFNTLWSAEDDHAGHFRRYTVKSLSKVLDEAGFEVEFASPFFSMLTVPLFAMRTVPSKLGLRTRVEAETTAKEHSAPAGVFGRMFQQRLNAERKRLQRGKRSRFGTSLIVVAKKKASSQTIVDVPAPLAKTHRLSVVIPIYNSSAILPALLDRLLPVLERICVEHEVILVNDGSPDASWETIVKEIPHRPNVRGLRLSRNFGQHNALLCGIRAARFPVCITMDDDLQHPPEELPKLLAKLDEGYDLVYGAPQQETHGAVRDTSSKMVKRAMRHVLGVQMAEAAGAFRCFRTRLRDAFADYRSPQVNLEVLLSWATTNLAAVRVPHGARHSGQSGYTFRKLLNHTSNLVLGYSTAPLRLANLLGLLIILFGIVVLLFVLGRYVVEGSSVPGFPFLASVVAIFSGVQLISLGVIGEYLARIYTRTMERPTFVVAEEVRSP